jgi:hypothetical protein
VPSAQPKPLPDPAYCWVDDHAELCRLNVDTLVSTEVVEIRALRCMARVCWVAIGPGG